MATSSPEGGTHIRQTIEARRRREASAAAAAGTSYAGASAPPADDVLPGRWPNSSFPTGPEPGSEDFISPQRTPLGTARESTGPYLRGSLNRGFADMRDSQTQAGPETADGGGGGGAPPPRFVLERKPIWHGVKKCPEGDPELYETWRRALLKKTYDTGVTKAQASRFVLSIKTASFDDLPTAGGDDVVQDQLDTALDAAIATALQEGKKNARLTKRLNRKCSRGRGRQAGVAGRRRGVPF